MGRVALIEQLQQTGVLENGERLTYARGLIIEDYRGLRAVSHGGSWIGFQAELLRFPERGISVAALCNAGSAGQPWALARAVADAVLEDQLQPVPETEPEAKTGDDADTESTLASTPAGLDRHVGIYSDPEDALVRRIEHRDGSLWYVRDGGNDTQLVAEGNGRFRMLNAPVPATLQFVQDDHGTARMTVEVGGSRSVMHAVASFAPDAESLAEFAGDYESAELDTRWRLAVDGDQLQLHPRRGEPLPLTPAFADAFTGSSLLRFERSQAREIIGFEVDIGRARGIGFRRKVDAALD